MRDEILRMDVSQIDSKIKRLIKNMGGSFFWDFLDFIIEIKESDYEIKILKARKFYVLYHLFEEISNRLYGKSVRTKGKVVSHCALATMKSELKNARILLVDDVLLHGRALEEVYQYLVEECHCRKDKIDLKVYLRNEDRNLIFGQEIIPKRKVHDINWSWMSCSFVDALMIAEKPYVSILPHFKVSVAENHINSKIKEMIRQSASATSKVQEYNGGKLWIYLGSKCASCFECSFVRIYEYQDESAYSLVPYMFLKPMDRSVIEGLVDSLLEHKLLEFSSVDYLKMGNEKNRFENLNDEDYKYLYNVLTYAGSKFFGMWLIGSIGGDQYVQWDDSVENDGICCRVNFQYSDFDLLQRIFGEADTAMENIAQRKDMEQKGNGVEVEEADVNEIIDKVNKRNVKSIGHFLELYLSYSGKKDRELADIKHKRMNGLRFSRLMDCVDYENNKSEFWCEVVKEIDLGKGTIISLKNKKGYYENILYAGEQSFTCGEEYRIVIGYSLLSFKNFLKIIPKNAMLGEEEVLCRKLIQDIIYNYPEIKENLPEEESYNLTKESSFEAHKDYYSSRYKVYENTPMMQEAMKIVLTHEKQILEGTNHA